MSIHRHTLYNFAGQVLALGIMLITVPWYLAVIGFERYGVLSIMWLLLGYFGVFDLGIGRAVAQRSAAMARSHAGERHAVLGAGLAVSLPLALVGATVLYVTLRVVLERWIRMGPMLQAEVPDAVLWVAVGLIPHVLAESLRGALLGAERFLAINVVDVLSRTLLQILPLAAALLVTPSLEHLAQAAFAARVVSMVVWAVACRLALRGGLVPRWAPRLVIGLLKYGSWVTVGALVAPLLSGIERVFLGNMHGAATVTEYTVPFSLVAPIALLTGSLSTALFPRFSALPGAQGTALARQALSAVLLLVTPVMVALIFVVGPFLSVWIDADFARTGAEVAQILIFGFWANSLAKVFHTKLQGEGLPDVVARVHLVQLLPHLVLLVLLTGAWGVRGAALAWTLRAGADMAMLGWKSRAWPQRASELGVPLALVLAAFASGYTLAGRPLPQLAAGVLLTTTALIWSWRHGLGAHLRTLVRQVLGR